MSNTTHFLDNAIANLFTGLVGKEFLVDGVTYCLGEKLGIGGQAWVYAAHRKDGASADYVIKILLGTSIEISLDRGLIEDKVGKLEHPNLVKALGIGTSADSSLIGILFERIHGVSLRDYLTEHQSVPVETAIEWGWQLADVLSYIHSTGFIHRDIKPSNIMITDDTQTIKLTDFGLCYDLNDRLDLTQTGVAGTLHYLSPERASGKISPQSDIYSIGMVLYEMVYGKRIRKPNEVTTDCPAEFAEVIRCCLQPQQKKRYNSAGLLKEDLTSLQEGKPAKNVRRYKNHRRLFRIGQILTAMLFILASIFFWYGNEKTDERKTELHFNGNKNYTPFRLLDKEPEIKMMSDVEMMQTLIEINNSVHKTNGKAEEKNAE